MEPAHRRSVLYRPLRRLFDEGKPPGDVRALWYELSPKRRLPFAALYGSPGSSLVLWPASPPGASTATTKAGREPFDHITVDLRNHMTHITGFNVRGERCHGKVRFPVHRIPGSDAALWCVCAFRWTVLEQQCGEFEWTAPMPKSDQQRREQEFIKYAEQVMEQPVFLTIPAPRGDYVISVFYVLGSGKLDWFPPKAFHMGSFWNDEIDGWPDGDRFDVALSAVEAGAVHIGIATACPPGHLKRDVFVGLPMAQSAKGPI